MIKSYILRIFHRHWFYMYTYVDLNN